RARPNLAPLPVYYSHPKAEDKNLPSKITFITIIVMMTVPGLEQPIPFPWSEDYRSARGHGAPLRSSRIAAARPKPRLLDKAERLRFSTDRLAQAQSLRLAAAQQFTSTPRSHGPAHRRLPEISRRDMAGRAGALRGAGALGAEPRDNGDRLLGFARRPADGVRRGSGRAVRRAQRRGPRAAL